MFITFGLFKLDKMKNYSLLLLLLVLCNCVKNDIPKDFVQNALPEKNSNANLELNNSKKEFSVEIVENKLKVDSVRDNTYNQLKFFNGKLVAIDKGEWGGKIEFVADNPSQKPLLIKEGNVKFIFKLNNKIYFIEGLAHLGINEGELFELEYSKNKFTYKKVLKFEDAPEAMSIYNYKLYIAGYENFYVIDKDKNKVVFKNQFWCNLLPNSVAVINESEIYIGIRAGIAKFNSVTGNAIFYKYVKR